MYYVCAIFCFSFGSFSIMGDALLCFEVLVHKCVIENGVLARCELLFLVRPRRLVCRVVGLVLFISVGIVFLHDVCVRVCVCF